MLRWNASGEVGLKAIPLLTALRSRPGANPHTPRTEGAEDPAELEKYCIKWCNTCEEDGIQEVASGYCEELGDYLCASCVEAHKKTKLTKNMVITEVSPAIINHPRKDAAEGREVKKDSEGYLVRIYRCGTVKAKGVKDGGDSRWGPSGGPPHGMMGPGMMPGMMGPGMMPHGWGPYAGGRPPGPGFGGPGGPGAAGAAGAGGGEGEAVKSGLVNDPMANLGPGQAGNGQFPGGGPGQWGPWGPGPWGPWGGPRPPGPPGGMMCISQGISGKVCKHFNRGQCTYGNRCIHVHLVPNPAMQQQAPNNEEESDDDEEEEEGEGEEGGAGNNATKAAEVTAI